MVTGADKKELQRYLRWVADEMGLRDWRFEFVVTKDMPDANITNGANKDKYIAYGCCSPTIGQRKAHIFFHEDFKEDLTRDEQREVVVHELVHCHMIDMREFVRSGMLNLVVQQTYDALSFGYDLAWEHAVDAIARSWAPKFPLIAWPKQ